MEQFRRIHYDPNIDALYIKFDLRKQQLKTVQVSGDVDVDLGDDDRLVGIEVLDASKNLDLKALLHVDVEVLGASEFIRLPARAWNPSSASSRPPARAYCAVAVSACGDDSTAPVTTTPSVATPVTGATVAPSGAPSAASTPAQAPEAAALRALDISAASQDGYFLGNPDAKVTADGVRGTSSARSACSGRSATRSR